MMSAVQDGASRGVAPATLDAIRGLGTVVGVWAHPDDDVYLSAGIMALARLTGNDVTVALATRGQAGGDLENLAAVRTNETTEALACLGVEECRWLGFTDGRCSEVPLSRAVQAVADVLCDTRPDTVLTFPPDGLTGHPDHQAISHWVQVAVATAGLDCRVLHAAITPDAHRRSREIDNRFNVFLPGYPHLTPRGDLALDLTLTGDLLDQKVAALMAHESQTRALIETVGLAEYRQWVAEETFMVAPPQTAASPGRTRPTS